jgi:hypothetical protein
MTCNLLENSWNFFLVCVRTLHLTTEVLGYYIICNILADLLSKWHIFRGYAIADLWSDHKFFGQLISRFVLSFCHPS